MTRDRSNEGQKDKQQQGLFQCMFNVFRRGVYQGVSSFFPEGYSKAEQSSDEAAAAFWIFLLFFFFPFWDRFLHHSIGKVVSVVYKHSDNRKLSHFGLLISNPQSSSLL